MGVSETSQILSAQELALLLGLHVKLPIHNIVSQKAQYVAAAGLEANLCLSCAVITFMLAGAATEEDAVVM